MNEFNSMSSLSEIYSYVGKYTEEVSNNCISTLGDMSFGKNLLEKIATIPVKARIRAFMAIISSSEVVLNNRLWRRNGK